MGRLIIDLSDQQHRGLEAMATAQGKSATQYALERLSPGVAEADQAWRELQALLGQRIEEGRAGKVSTTSVGDVLDEELSEDRA